MEKKIYLIYTDSQDDSAAILGYVEGTEEDADKYCDEYNAPLKGTPRSEATWIELDKLNK